MTDKIYAVRHGETSYNAEAEGGERIRGWLDIPLNPEGREQAHIVAREVKNKPIEVIWSSDFRRTEDTARVMAAAIKKNTGTGPRVILTPRLRPWHLGNFQGKLVEEVLPTIQKYADEAPDKRVPGGESFNDFLHRLLGFMRGTMANEQYKTTSIVTHSRVLRIVEGWVRLGVDKDEFDHDSVTGKEHIGTGGFMVLAKSSKGKWRVARIDNVADEEEGKTPGEGTAS